MRGSGPFAYKYTNEIIWAFSLVAGIKGNGM